MEARGDFHSPVCPLNVSGTRFPRTSVRPTVLTNTLPGHRSCRDTGERGGVVDTSDRGAHLYEAFKASPTPARDVVGDVEYEPLSRSLGRLHVLQQIARGGGGSQRF